MLTLLLLLFVSLSSAHSWIEQLSNIAQNGSYYRFGYPRGFVDKGSSADFNQSANVWLLPPLEQQPPFIRKDNPLCHPSQRNPQQSLGFPRLQALSGGTIAIRYAENGHATIAGGGKRLSGKPEKGGTVFVFFTQRPHSDEKLLDVLQWTRDGLGGDRRGLLLASENFDDGRCYQLGNGAALASVRKAKTPNPIVGQPNSEHELLCETDITLPKTIQPDIPCTLYWVWQWPTAPGNDPNYPRGRDEYYTSCMDVDIVKSLQPGQHDPRLAQQDPMPTAVSGFLSRTALTSEPLALYTMTNFGPNPQASSQSHSLHQARTIS